jgi:TolA-binding protein
MGRFLRRRFPPSIRSLWTVGILLGLGALAVGCSRGTLVGRQYDDFTAYYNTFHNAKQAFEKGLTSVTESESDIDRARYISVFPDPQAGSGGSAFEKAIRKSADLLRNHPNSKWVDDALLLIGRSRYYQQNYAGAAQKFREVIALEGEREGEARFRLARTLVAADQYSEAAEALRTGLEQEDDFGTWTARMRVVRGELFVRQETWADAETALSRGLEGSLPEEAGARAAFLLGQVRETLDDLDGARAAYRQVLKYDPTYQLAFAARLGAIEMQGRKGEAEKALDRLESLERGDNTPEMRGRIARVRAHLYRAQDRPDRAKRTLTTVLRAENTPRGAVQGRIHYDLATLYRETYENFTQAAAHFDTAATALSSGSDRGGSRTDQGVQMLPRAPTDAADQAERYQGLADRSQAVARMDSLLRLGRMPSSKFQEAVERIRKRRLKQQKREAQARRRRQRRFRGGAREEPRRGQSSQPRQNAVQTRGSDAGFLFHRDPALVQQGRRQFEQTWGDRPRVDNWRRVNAIQGSSGPSTAAEEEAGGEAQQAGGRGPSGPVVDLSAVPRDSASRAEMEKNRAVARYRLANALFRDAARPDSAETWFLLILEQDREHPVTKKALYGLAQAQRAQGDTTGARKAYRQIVKEYPGTPYAKRARQQLGRERATPTSNLTTGQADSAYAQAYETWQKGNLDAALEKFLAVAKTHPETSTAPRALLAAGVVYHRSARQDTSRRPGTRFERYVDSLAQSHAGPPTGPEAGADTTGAAQEATPSPERPPTDTADVPDGPQRRADTTAGPAPPKRMTPQSEPPSDTMAADSTGARRPVPDTSSGEGTGPQALRRRVDSTDVDRQDRAPRRSDSTTMRSPVALRDTTVHPRQETDSVRSKTGQRAHPDSLQARSDSLRARPNSAQAHPDSVQAGPEQKRSTSPLEILLTYLTEQYSGTPAAKRAQALLAHLKKDQAAADSSARDSARSDSVRSKTPSPSGPPSDSTVAAAPSDTTPAPRGESRSTPPSDSTARPRRRPSDTTRSAEGTPRPVRRRDSTAIPTPDSTGSLPSSDSSGTR